MNKLLSIGSLVLVLGLLIAGSTTAIFAHGPDDSDGTTDNDKAWEDMHEACESGDWEAMAEAAEAVHGENFDHMPHHNEDGHGPANHWGGMGGHMGSGVMGGMH